MSTFTPFFPPLILDKCLDLAKYITEEKAGKAALEVNLGGSRFSFSADFSSTNRTGRSSQGFKLKKKSPSVLRRDAARKEKFLEKKRIASPPTSVLPPDPSSTSPTPCVDTATVTAKPVIEEGSSSMEASEDTETMDMIVDEVSVPVKTPPRNTSNSDDGIDDSKETILIFCAPNKRTAIKLAKQNFSKAKYIGQQSSYSESQHHFGFQVSLKPTDFSLIERDARKLNSTVNLIEYETLRPSETVIIGDHHCQECHKKR